MVPVRLPLDGSQKPGIFGIFASGIGRSEEHTSELQSQSNLVCRLLLEKKKCSTACCTEASSSKLTGSPTGCAPTGHGLSACGGRQPTVVTQIPSRDRDATATCPVRPAR